MSTWPRIAPAAAAGLKLSGIKPVVLGEWTAKSFASSGFELINSLLPFPQPQQFTHQPSDYLHRLTVEKWFWRSPIRTHLAVTSPVTLLIMSRLCSAVMCC
jgi:hypothetical protein